jgi:hypothetical protein
LKDQIIMTPQARIGNKWKMEAPGSSPAAKAKLQLATEARHEQKGKKPGQKGRSDNPKRQRKEAEGWLTAD